jgi:triacylglycerol lipase
MITFIVSLTLILLSLVLIFLIIGHIFVFVYLVIEMRLAKLTDSSYPQLTTKELSKNALKEFILVLAKFYLYPLKFVNFSILDFSKNPNVIILIHGFGRSQIDWLWFKRRFKGVSFSTFNSSPPLASIEEITRRLAPKIKKIISKNPTAKISLVGHSMGGVVACYYKVHFDVDQKIHNLITIGSPLHGTKLAVAAAGENMRQIEPNSQFLEDLRSKLNTQQVNIFHIATKADNLIFPWTSPILPQTQAKNILILERESHLGMIYNLQVIQQIKQWLLA